MAKSEKADRTAVAAFSARLNRMVQDSLVLATAAVADRAGIFKILAESSNPSQSIFLNVEQISEIGKLNQRYVKEVCGCLSCAGFIQYSSEFDGFAIGPAEAKILADEDFALFGGGWFDMLPCLYRAVPGVAHATKQPGQLTGVPFALQSEWGFSRGMDRLNGPGIRAAFTRNWLPNALPQVVERLRVGIKVADLGTGAGAVAFSIANSFGDSQVIGIDIDQRSIDRANSLNPGLTNLRFVCKDIKDLEAEQFDLITNHDCIHDLVNPVGVLQSVRRALKPNGVFFSMEPKNAGETLQENYATAQSSEDKRGPVAMWYGISTLHCMTVSCAHGGAGLGSATFGPRLYEKLARQAGFTDFKVVGDNLVNNFYALTAIPHIETKSTL